MRCLGKMSVLTVAALVITTLSAPGKLAAVEHEIRINGLAGNVEQPLDVARPGDKVFVKICPADLINYEYTIEKGEEALKESFPIVGVGTEFQPTSGAQVPALGPTSLSEQDLEAVKDPMDREILTAYLALRTAVAAERAAVSETVGDVDRIRSRPLFESSATCKHNVVPWPADLQMLTKRRDENGKKGGTVSSFFETYDNHVRNLGELDASILSLLARIQDRDLLGSLAGAAVSQFRADLRRELQSLQGEVQSLRTTLNQARDIVERWAKILTLHPEPVLRQSYLMPKTSFRYTITVKRKPITAQARREAPEGTDPAKIEPPVIAATSFENRALYHFNVSLGMVGAWRDENRDFEVAPSLDAQGAVVHHVREIKRDETETKPAAFLGLYLNRRGVDLFDPARRPTVMVMLGSEISSSPKDFFLGFGVDTRQGIVAGIGVTEYESVSPAPGWEVGQVIATGTDGKPKLATVPKVRKDELGFYAFLGFRPSIFRAFLDRRKP